MADERDVMHEMRAAVCLLNSKASIGQSPSGRAFAHVSVLYPNMSLEKRLKLAWAIRENEE